jgi:hypothetical protein
MSWFTPLFSRRRISNDLSAEIQEHLDERIEELIAEGMPRKRCRGCGAARIWERDVDCRRQPGSVAVAID